jgi:hypothetical protein
MIPQEKIDELKAKHKDLWIVEIEDSFDILLRKPTNAEYELAIGASDEGATRTPALRNLALQCAVYPDRKEIVALFDDQPGVATRVGLKALEAAGTKREVKAKKL